MTKKKFNVIRKDFVTKRIVIEEKMTSKEENCDNNASNKSEKRSPPDGGFGWLIVIAYGTANVS